MSSLVICRAFIGAHSPAQWPDCNRVVEAIFTRLCELYKNGVRCDGARVSRFQMVTRTYKHIRECIITNAKVMTETTMQLPEVNAATVTQWLVYEHALYTHILCRACFMHCFHWLVLHSSCNLFS